MSPLEAAKAALTIANREKLALAAVARWESGATDTLDWFTRNIRRFFAPESDGGVESISDTQLRRYIAWMRTTK